MSDIKPMSNEMLKTLDFSLLIKNPFIGSGNTRNFATTKDCEGLKALNKTEQMVIKLLKTEDVVFNNTKEAGNKSLDYMCYRFDKSRKIPLDYMCLEAICDYELIAETFPYHNFNPLVNLFIKHLKDQCDIIQSVVFACAGSRQSYLITENLCERLNKFIYNIRQEAKNSLIKAINNSHRSVNKNSISIKRYIDYLFNKHARLLVIRIDFSYTNKNLRTRNPVKLEKVINDRIVFFKSLIKKELFKSHLLGYVWKLEHGNIKGFHYHLIFFLDGAKVRKDITIATEIGEHWKFITNGIGNYWNCNAKKETYKHLGIGMINHNDIELRKNLIDASQYLTKVDYYLSLKPTDGKHNRIFGRGEIKQQQKLKRGRKRNTTSSEIDSVK